MKKRIKGLLLTVLAVVYVFAGFSNAFAVERVYILPSTTCKKAPAGNIFQLKGSSDKFILLDSTDEGYFVLSLKYCTTRAYSQDGNPVAFDPEDENSIAYWLNNDYLNDADISERLPQEIIDNLVERVYHTEGGGDYVSFKTDYDVKCKVVLLSQTEWSKYNAKFGYADDTSYSFWFLRSVRGLTGAPLVAAILSPNSGLTVDGRWSSVIGIRPAFYLSKDFFKKVSVDVENTGDAVMSIIRKDNNSSVLNSMYSGKELKTLIESDIAPMADSVTITGRGIVGEKIVGEYDFVSLDENAENGTMIQWLKSKDGETWSTILGANSLEYIPTSADVDYYVKMKVSPMTGSMAGASYESASLKCKIREISKPVASEVKIEDDSQIKPGTILSAQYSYYDENRDICSETEYIWETSADKITSEKTGSERYYKITNQDAGKYIRVGVIPKKKTNSADERKIVAGDASFSEWMSVENLTMASSVKIKRNNDAEITISKTNDTLTLKGILIPTEGGNAEKLTAVYDIDKNDAYDVICEWQGADSEYGLYGCIKSGTDVLEYVPDKTMWVRAKLYTRNSNNIGKAVYSEPVFMGEDKALEEKGDSTLTKQLSAGKEYEVWISNADCQNSYAYSFKFSGDIQAKFSSEKYMIKTIPQSGAVHVIGTMTSNAYSNDFCFKAGELTAQKDEIVTISDVLTTSPDDDGNMLPASSAKVFIIEK